MRYIQEKDMLYNTWRQLSPEVGRSLQPTVRTGVEGGASLMGFLLSSNMALTFPHVLPATSTAPHSRVPCLTTTLATGLQTHRLYTQNRGQYE